MAWCEVFPVIRRFVLLSIVCSLLLSCNEQVEKTRAENVPKAKQVIALLEQYHARNGRYPDTLVELEHSIGSQLPLPSRLAASEWVYERHGDDYVLGFTLNMRRHYPIWYFDSSDQRWHSDE